MNSFLQAETVLTAGNTPHTLPGALVETPTYVIAKEEFLLKLSSGLTFHYVFGKGVTVSRPETVTDAEMLLFFNGSVYGAIAWLNGFVPLHASAVVHEGQVHAFTGDSGAGKSTLATALGLQGLPLLADDVLVLDMRDPSAIICLPGHKQIKLWGDAIELTGAVAGEQVSPGVDKYFAVPPGGVCTKVLPLAHLSFLQDHSDKPKFTRLTGAQRFASARLAFYRPYFCNAIIENHDLFALISRISQQVPMSLLDRPRGKDMFDNVAAFVAQSIRNGYD